MNNKPIVYADFNKLDENGRAMLCCVGTLEDVERLGISLCNGMNVTLFMPDGVDEFGAPDGLEVDAMVEYNASFKCWVGRFVAKDLDYRSKKSSAVDDRTRHANHSTRGANKK